MSPENIAKWSQLKGIAVVGTGDFTHPSWIGELREKLEPRESGLYGLKQQYMPDDVPLSCRTDVSFMLTAEVSTIYSKYGKTRKVHSILVVPDFSIAEIINKRLAKIGNISSDGRPILGLDAKDLLKIVLDASPEAMLIPAHAWTPHFSVFGAMSGFDSLEECYDELTDYIFAIETGLSSDPAMNRRLSSLDRLTLVSNSDAHSPSKLGREANMFNTEIAYKGIVSAVKEGKGFEGTIEFFPEEGKYHYDGHRSCNVRMHPVETLKNDARCPVCGGKLTIGVLHRIERLADRPENGTGQNNGKRFRSVIPLMEILSEVIGKGVNTKIVQRVYSEMLSSLGNEFHILLDASLSDIEGISSREMARSVGNMRKGEVKIEPGYDGVFGSIKTL